MEKKKYKYLWLFIMIAILIILLTILWVVDVKLLEKTIGIVAIGAAGVILLWGLLICLTSS